MAQCDARMMNVTRGVGAAWLKKMSLLVEVVESSGTKTRERNLRAMSRG